MKKAEPDWSRLLRKRPFRERMFTADMWDQVEKQLDSPNRSSLLSVQKALLAGFAVLLVCLILLIGFVDVPALRPYGSGQLAALFDSRSPITDDTTKEELPLLNETTLSQRVHVIVNDGMAWSLQFGMSTPVVVDPDYYDNLAISRGDVVYFKTQPSANSVNEPYDISRVVGLPGETIRLQDGQITIDGRELDAFYGSASRGKEDLKDWNTSMTKDVKLGEGQYFLLGDVWWRSFNDSQTAGGFDRESIQGKVVGYMKPKKDNELEWTELYDQYDKGRLRITAVMPERANITELYQRIKVVWGQRYREYYWHSVANASYEPEVYMTDMDHDKLTDAVIVLTTAYGSGVHVTEPHIIRHDLTEIPVRDPIKGTLEAVTSEVKVSDGKVDVKVTLGKQTIAKQFEESDAGMWFDKLGLGSIVKYRLDEEGRLWADITGFVSPGTVVAELSVRFDLQDREYVPAAYTMRDISEDAQRYKE
ncbi:signal peptidase I [Paenibacillus mendelii]|uniref:Signal peptidase I n=1 Tax=Paenibacillus mendelii TaxID=206163 RepID=A0ABV6JD26_9BACL|nr:signal peptidase I [Paenibacillus mendelii]MCQ6562452.1 signal peptidase I [Paenibacillus mendelii]